MALIGEFEVAVKQADPNREADQFKLNGEVFTVSEADLTIHLGLFARAAVSGLDTAEMEGLAALIDVLEGIVVDDDKPRLLHLAKKVNLDGDTLLKIVQTVMEAQTGRPTAQPSDSSAGLSSTGASSPVSPLGAVPPIQQDPRVRELMPLEQAGMRLVG